METWPESHVRRSSGSHPGLRKTRYAAKPGDGGRDERGTRELTLKGCLIIAIVLARAAAFGQQQPPEIPYDSVPDFLKLPPDLYLGEAAGVAVNSEGHVFVLSRGNT